MARPGLLSEAAPTTDHTVVVLVAAVDRRIVPALRVVTRLACTDALALHVSVDPDETRRLTADWMSVGLSWLPLFVEGAEADGLAASVREAVRRIARASPRVTVVVPEMVLEHWWQQPLHRRSARRIAVQLQSIPGVTAIVVPLPVPPAGGTRRPLG